MSNIRNQFRDNDLVEIENDPDIHIIHPENAIGRDAQRFRNMARRVQQQNGGRVRFRLAPLDEEANNVTVSVTIKGLYEVKSGENSTSGIREFTHQYVINDVNGSRDRLVRGCKEACNALLESIKPLMDVSGYQIFVPMHYYASNSLSDEEMNQRVQARTVIRHYSRMPLNFHFLRRMGVADEDLKASARTLNCITSKLDQHMAEHRVLWCVKIGMNRKLLTSCCGENFAKRMVK